MAMSWQYIAGFFDGEGSIGVTNGEKRGGSGNAKLALHQSDTRGLVLLSEIQEFLFDHGIASRLGEQRIIPNTYKHMYRLYIYNRTGVLDFIKAVMPYVHIKKVECQDVARYLILYPIIPGNVLFKKPVPVRTHCSRGHDLAVVGRYTRYRADGRKDVACAQCAKDRATARYTDIGARVRRWL